LVKNCNLPLLNKYPRFKSLKRYLTDQNFDLIIDSRSRPTFFKELIIKKILYNNQKVIYIVHSHKLKNYLPNNKFLANLLYSNAEKIVTVSNTIRELIHSKYEFKNLEFIPNPIIGFKDPDPALNCLKLPHRYILFFGRILDSVKNISLLLESYSLSKLPSMDIKLVILGDGPDISIIMKKVTKMKLDKNIKFIAFNPNPKSIIQNSIFTVLTSRYEGFPMALIESLSLGVPVVSVNCKSGPKEIVVNKNNGLLVENHNSKALAIAFNLMVDDRNLYKNCLKNAKKSVESYFRKNISSSWRSLLSKI
tara:strand:+ start:463 stop:1383 length:921 start_codon:yes stop_codon:yes gene_type:complete